MHQVWRAAPWRFVFLPLIIGGLLAYVTKLIDRGQLKCWMMRWMLGRPARDRLNATVASFVQKVEAAGVYKQARQQIAADKAAGARIVLATASFDFYVRPLASAWGIEDVIATRSVRDEAGHLLPKIDGENCYGAAKRDMVDAYLREQWRDALPPITFYSDHHSDRPMFERASVPVATNPNAKLRAMAQNKGWSILDWRDG